MMMMTTTAQAHASPSPSGLRLRTCCPPYAASRGLTLTSSLTPSSRPSTWRMCLVACRHPLPCPRGPARCTRSATGAKGDPVGTGLLTELHGRRKSATRRPWVTCQCEEVQYVLVQGALALAIPEEILCANSRSGVRCPGSSWVPRSARFHPHGTA